MYIDREEDPTGWITKIIGVRDSPPSYHTWTHLLVREIENKYTEDLKTSIEFYENDETVTVEFLQTDAIRDSLIEFATANDSYLRYARKNTNWKVP